MMTLQQMHQQMQQMGLPMISNGQVPLLGSSSSDQQWFVLLDLSISRFNVSQG